MSRLRMSFSFLIVFSLVTGAAAVGYAAPSAASQESSRFWASSTSDDWLAKGWLHGYADGTVRLGKSVSRAEFLAFVNRAFALTNAGPADYPDLRRDAWYDGDFAIALRAGYVDSIGGLMRPAQAVTREEGASMLASLLHLDLADEDVSAFKDGADIAAANRGAVAALFKIGVLNAFPEDGFKPAEPLTRAGAVAMIYAAWETGMAGN
ncbi:hypothetical protein GZH47_16960 [Paenibacillus rhizovicinus]|uniref:SLH domain-containing protein n=1 Tax=Paenibacillus rhizovicinus TaxID=2704463 RepID=A0A6C0P1I9_9BACL|nr:S-layer homology domain-containing protein [Paenibacillus rhizovicinus]QHW32329.1 hypothetical protein GZH47_16960 [Paenibacillus rhizovicinus]